MKMMTLDLESLRDANMVRQMEWPGSEAVDLAFRGLELAGETGELCNKVKKLVRLNRGIQGTTEGREALMQAIRDEAADVMISLDLLCMDLDLDLSLAVAAKFNETSLKHGMQTRLTLG
jgi:NTP pyrophosphatase (non-canonical NTP hydrolase)